MCTILILLIKLTHFKDHNYYNKINIQEILLKIGEFMKKTLISTCIVFLFLSLGVTSANAFNIETNKKQFITNENSPTDIENFFVVKVNLGTYKIEMKESGQGHVDQYPFTFNINTSNLSKPTITVEKFFNNSKALFPLLQPQITIVFIENRPIHPAYNISIAFFASGSGPNGTDFWNVLTIFPEENEIGELRKTLDTAGGGFTPYPWQNKTYYPKIDIHNKFLDLNDYNIPDVDEMWRLYKKSLIHTDITEFNVNVTINKTKQKAIQPIWSFPFLHLLKTIFKNKFSFLFPITKVFI